MNKKIYFVIVALILVASAFLFLFNDFNDEKMKNYKMENDENVYSGPIPEGYDEEHFRKTGETKLLEGVLDAD